MTALRRAYINLKVHCWADRCRVCENFEGRECNACRPYSYQERKEVRELLKSAMRPNTEPSVRALTTEESNYLNKTMQDLTQDTK